MCLTSINVMADQFSYNFQIDGIRYAKINETKVKVVTRIKSGSGDRWEDQYKGDIVIPQYVEYGGNKYMVTTIGEDAFNGANLSSITLPQTISTIENSAFRDCTISSIELPDNVNTIGQFAFIGCSKLKNINIPEGVTSIYGQTFQACAIETINIPSSVSFIGKRAFYGCKSLHTVNGMLGITSIGDEAFSGCENLEFFSIPSIVEEMGEAAFQDCKKLTSIVIPPSVKTVRLDTFNGCTKLKNVTISEGVQKLEHGAFEGCISLSEILIPASLTEIYLLPFSYCSNLTSIKVAENNPKFDSRDNCNAIMSSTNEYYWGIDNLMVGCNGTIIPKNTKKLAYNNGVGAFRGCTLASIKIPKMLNSFSEEDFHDCYIGEISVEEGNLMYDSRNNCNAIIATESNTICVVSSKTYIPQDIVKVKGDFRPYKEMNKLIIYASVPPELQLYWTGSGNKYEYYFTNEQFQNMTLIVPKGSKDAYEQAEGWNNFWNIKEFDPEYGDPITITIKNCSRGYGEANPTFEYEVTGGDLEGTPSFSCTATATSPIGTYQITGSKGSVTNSNVTFVSGVLTVTKAMLTVTADNCTMTQGGQMPELTLSYSGFKNDETASVLITRPTASCVATTESNTGDYEITVSGGEAQNYDFTYVAGTLTIEPTAGRQLFASNITAYKGKQVEMPVSLTNEQTIAGFQFDLKLPTGISVAKSGNSYLASLTSRASGLNISVSKLESGDYRFVAFSNEANNISGNSGEVLTITLDIPQTVTIGESTITIKNVVLTAIVNEASQSVYADNATSTLSVQNFTLGDTNGDGFINVTDVAGIVTHVSGQAQTNFNEIAADVNNDGLVDANDVTAEINTVKANASVGTGVSSGKSLYGNALSAYKGKQIVLPIVLENTQAMAGYQFDLQLPAGVSLATDGAALTERATGLTLYSNALATNQYRFVVVSTAGNTIATGNGAVMNLTLNVTDDAANGANTVAISNVILTAKSGNNVSSVYSDQANITLTVGSYSLGDVNGDGYINVTDVVCIVYDILGQTQTGFIRIAADVNNDGEVNITDVTAVVSMILSNEGRAAARGTTRSSEHFTVFDDLALKDDGDGTLSLHVDVPDNYVASQMEIHLAEGQTLKNISLNSHYKDSHQLVYDKVGRNCYRVLIFSMGNEAYPTDDDELIKIAVTGSGGDIEIREAVMVTSQKEQRFYEPISFYQAETATELVDVYSTDGRLVKSQAKDTSGLRKGVYIIKGKKVVVK